jgi:hypothetical protein
MRKLSVTLAVTVAAFVAEPAGGQVLRFDEIPGTAGGDVLIGDFYNGAGGAAYDFGVQFTGSAFALCLNHAGNPACSNTSWGGDPAAAARGTEQAGMYFLTTPVMNRAAGFTTGFSFYYAKPNATPAGFEVWSGLNGTGVLLGSTSFAATPDGASLPNCFDANYCPFFAASVAFAGTGQSVVFTGGVNQIAFDDITFGSVVPGAVVPEPSTVALLASGLLAVGAAVRRRQARG